MGGGFDDMIGIILWMIKAFSIRCSRMRIIER